MTWFVPNGSTPPIATDADEVSAAPDPRIADEQQWEPAQLAKLAAEQFDLLLCEPVR